MKQTSGQYRIVTHFPTYFSGFFAIASKINKSRADFPEHRADILCAVNQPVIASRINVMVLCILKDDHAAATQAHVHGGGLATRLQVDIGTKARSEARLASSIPISEFAC